MAKLNLLMALILVLQPQYSFAQYTTLGPKTDAEKTADSSYYHQEYHAGALDDICGESGTSGSGLENYNAKDVEFVCSGQESATWMTLVTAASGAYGMLAPMLMLGGGGKFQSKTPKDKTTTQSTEAKTSEAPTTEGQTTEGTTGTENKDTTKKDEGKEKQDLCILIPMVGEAAANAWNLIETSKIEADLPEDDATPTGTEQYEYIMAIKRTHETNAKTSTTKALTYTGTVTCYLAYAPTIQTDAGYWLKLAASGVLAGFYWAKQAKHKQYAKIAQAIAEKLPKLGECSPTSDPQCYCSQPTTQYDSQYCLPSQAIGRVSSTMNGTACVDSNLQVDPTCSCQAAGSCFGTSMVSGLSGLNLGSAYTGSTKGAVDALSSGTYDSSAAASLIDSGLAAARNALSQMGNDFPKDLAATISNAGNSDEIESLVKAGIPRPLAAISASMPKTAASKDFVAQNNKSMSNLDLRKALSGQQVRFESGSGAAKKVTKADPAAAPAAKAGAPTGQVLQFAEKAHQAAQINRNPDVNLFDIITKRYRLSGEERLK